MKRKKILKIIIGFFAALVILVICGVLYLKYFLPNIKVKDLKVEVTKERLERGKYLANHVLVCVDCHSKRDWSRYSGPRLYMELKGWEVRSLIKKWGYQASI